MGKIILNKKEYPDTHFFEKRYIERYCNLCIYPLVGELERLAGFLNDLATAFDGRLEILADPVVKLFLQDNLMECNGDGPKIVYIHEDFTPAFRDTDIVVTKNVILNPSFKSITFYDKTVYMDLKYYTYFKNYFKYYFDEKGEFNYDNLICYTMIVKNAGPELEKVLQDNLPIIDRWCILDTGSTDGTQDLIRRVLKDKRGELYEEPFVDFKVSRNRCLDLAGTTCKFIIMLDDTYSVRGDLRSFLSNTRGDQFSDTFSLLIQSADNEYYSNRIIKSQTGLRYIHRIHEVIDNTNNVNVTIPREDAFIFDNRSDYMEQRTMDRKQFDLELLFKEVEEFPDDPRALYYIAQTYGCIGDEINKAKYFRLRIDHPVEGYVQEKIDTLFELARCYNFKVDCLTDQLLTQPLTEQQWLVCEDLYLRAYRLDKNRPDSLYFIGIHYYLRGDRQRAYDYLKQGFLVGYPINSQYSLKPTLTFHFLPKFLAELCYYFGDYQTGVECSSLFLTSSQFNDPSKDSWNMMLNWYKIHEQLVKMPKVVDKPVVLDRPIFAIVTDGGWEPWTGSDILTKGLGGSETWIIETARNIPSSYFVVVFCKCDRPSFFGNVGYNPINMFHEFAATHAIKECIVSRYIEYVPVALRGNVENVHIIFHDNLSPELIIPVDPKIKNIWGLTKWHADSIKQNFPQFEPITSWNNYGVTPLDKPVSKIKNKFIYSSFPNRGLIVLLKMWPKIIMEFPDATLDIYCDLQQEWVNGIYPDMMNSIKKLLRINRTGVQVHGWVDKQQLAEAWSRSEYFLYPCIFEETFCLTALEAAISGTCIISNGLAALGETARHGILVEGNPLTYDWENRCFEKLKYIVKSHNYRDHIIEKNYEWAKTLTWKDQTRKLLEFIK